MKTDRPSDAPTERRWPERNGGGEEVTARDVISRHMARVTRLRSLFLVEKRSRNGRSNTVQPSKLFPTLRLGGGRGRVTLVNAA